MRRIRRIERNDKDGGTQMMARNGESEREGEEEEKEEEESSNGRSGESPHITLVIIMRESGQSASRE
jgi:hypothetical protein